MSWRIITIQNPARLSLKNSQLCLEREGEFFTLPIEDICALVLDSPQITLTHGVLSFLQKHNVIAITCDETHTPCGVLLGFHQHSRQSEISALQRTISLPLQKRLWQKIVQQKILNQARLLQHYGYPDFKTLVYMADKVDSGDKGNIEAQAARVYWPACWV
jgi:CRISPR-associated protein Cas1